MRMASPSSPRNRALARVLASRGSDDEHTGQVQPMTGMPWLVPDPSISSSMFVKHKEGTIPGQEAESPRFFLRFPARSAILYPMASNEGASELMAALDYILNRCTIREIDAVSTAVERRKRDLVVSTGSSSLDPARAAREMTGAVNRSIEASMEGIKKTFRSFAEDLVAREAPDLSEEERSLVVSSLLEGFDSPPKGTGAGVGAGDGMEGSSRYRALSRKGLINGIPPDAMYEMVCQFVSYSAGSMSLADEAALRDEVGDWTNVYWKAFPQEVRSCVKEFLAGSLTGAEMDERLNELLR